MRFWAPIVLGWQFVALAWIFLILSLRSREVWAALVGALFAAGFCWYLWMNLGFVSHWLGPIAFAGTLLAVIAVALRRPRLAFAADLPYFLATSYLLVVVLRQ